MPVNYASRWLAAVGGCLSPPARPLDEMQTPEEFERAKSLVVWAAIWSHGRHMSEVCTADGPSSTGSSTKSPAIPMSFSYFFFAIFCHVNPPISIFLSVFPLLFVHSLSAFCPLYQHHCCPTTGWKTKSASVDFFPQPPAFLFNCFLASFISPLPLYQCPTFPYLFQLQMGREMG